MRWNLLKVALVSALASLSVDAFASYYETPFEGIDTFYPNPATLTLLEKNRLILAGTNLETHRSFIGTETTIPSLTPRRRLIQTGRANANAPYFIPAGHVGIPLPGERFFIGVSTVSPFNYVWHLNHPTTSIARHSSTYFDFHTLDVSPSLAYKITNSISAGIGFDVVRARAVTERFVPLTVTTQALLKNDLEGTGYGWHAGLLYHLSKSTLLGLNYRSQVGLRLTGFSKFITTASTTNITSARSSTLLPPITQFTALQWLTPQWSINGAIKYTQWNRIQESVLYNVAPTKATVVNLIHYKNAWDYLLGTEYSFTSKWRVNVDGVYTTTPTQTAYRVASTGDTPHYTALIGTRYQVTPAAAVFARYGHSFGLPVNVQTYSSAQTVDKGKTEHARNDFFTLQATFDFA